MSETPSSQSGSSTGANLDLSQIEDLDELASKIENFYKQDSSVKTRLAYHWERNHKFLDGDQWLVFDGSPETGGIWKKLTVSKANEHLPRPVTNLIFDGFQTLKSYLIKNKPRSTVRPNTQTYRDKSAAKIADLCLETNWERLAEQPNYEYAAACLLTYGTVFKKSFWDTTAATMVKVPRMVSQPTTDPNTGMVTGTQEVQAQDPNTGELLVDKLPLGDVNTDIIEPYRIAIDPMAADLHKAKWLMEFSIQTLEWIKETYGKEGDGYTGKIEELKEEKSLSGAMSRWSALKNSSGVKGSSGMSDIQSDSGDASTMSNSAVVKEYYERPTMKYPDGRLVVVANGICLYNGKSPCEGPELGDWHPYSECRWEIVPGRFWGKSPLDAGCEIQKQINSIDALIILTRKTMAVPQKLIPTGAGISKGVWTGRPGQEIEYRGGPENLPTIVPAHGVDGTVFQERAQRVEDLKAVMGNMDILKGDRPPGVTAASALNLLYEIGTGKLYPVLERWKRFVENDQKKQLQCISKGYKEPRESFIAMLRAKNTELAPEAINKFIGEDLYDNCNVIVEAGSNIPKLQAAQQAALQEAAQAGSLNMDMPANRAEYNRQMGISGFDNDVGPDTKRAEWENDMLDNVEHTPDQQPIVLYVDDDTIHMDVLARRMKEPSFVSASGAVQQAYMAHYQAHSDQQGQKAQQQAMEAMANGQPPGQPADAGAPSPAHGQGNGISQKQSNALRTDALVPGAIGGK